MHPYGFSAYQVLMYQTHGNSGLNAPRVPRAISSTALPAHDFTLTDSILTLKSDHVKRICQSGEILPTILSKTYRKRRTFLPASEQSYEALFQKTGYIPSHTLTLNERISEFSMLFLSHAPIISRARHSPICSKKSFFSSSGPTFVNARPNLELSYSPKSSTW